MSYRSNRNKVENLIEEFEQCHINGKNYADHISRTMNDFIKLVKKMKDEKNSIARHCPVCSYRDNQGFSWTKLFDSNKRISHKHIQTDESELQDAQKEAKAIMEELQEMQTELEKRTEEKDRVTENLNIQIAANNELVYTIGRFKDEINKLEILRQKSDELQNENQKNKERFKVAEQEKEQERVTFRDQINSVKEELSKKSLKINDLIEEVEKITEKDEKIIVELQFKIKSLEEKMTIKDKEIHDFNQERKRFENDVVNLKKNQNDLNVMQKQLADLEISKSELEEKNRMLLKSMDETETNNLTLLKTKSSRIETLETDLQNLKRQFSEMEVQSSILNGKNKFLQDGNDELKTSHNRLKEENDKLLLRLRSEEIKVTSLGKEKEQLRDDAEKKQGQLKELKSFNASLTLQLEHSRKEFDELIHQMEQLKAKPSKRIELGVFSAMKQGLTNIAMKSLSEQLKQNLDQDEIEVVLRLADTSQFKGPCIVFCISLSRLGADVQEALKGISVSSDVALLIFHHKEVHALPSQSSEKILTGPDYKQLGAIIDMAILSSKGIYDCAMNDVGIDKLVSFVKRF